MNIVQKLFVILVFVTLAGCAGIEKRSTADTGANEEPIYLTQCNKPFPIVFDQIDLTEVSKHAGYSAMLHLYPSFDPIVQTAISKSGCGTASESRYKVRASFDATGRLMGPTCGVQAGGYYGLFMGNLGGRCVNFKAAKVTLTVFDIKAKKDVLSVTAETDTSLEDEIVGRRFLKGIKENGGSEGVFSVTPEGRLVAGLMKKALDSLINQMQSQGLATLDSGNATPVAEKKDSATTFVVPAPRKTRYVAPPRQKEVYVPKQRNTYAP